MMHVSKPARFVGLQMAMATAMVLSILPAPLAAQEPSESRAVITIPNPRSANLLQLRGLGGRGSAHIQIGDRCHRLPVRLVAGDFSGESIRVQRNAPIIVEIRDPGTVHALFNGADIVSEDSRGILVLSGLSEDTGFVINPGRNISADIFGARAAETPCEVSDTRQILQTGN